MVILGGLRAYARIVLLDKNGNKISGNDQKTLVPTGANTWKSLSLTLEASEAGYAVIYVANESKMDVFFDEIEVSHERLVWQENAYYPFGLGIKPLEREGTPDHRWLYNEMNEREKVTGWDETKFRSYDYQIGRFNHVDPKAEMAGQEVMTPYHYSFNNPIRYNDPNGDTPWLVGALVGAATEYASQVVNNVVKNGGEINAEAFYKDIDVLDIAVSAGEGALTGGVSSIRKMAVKTTASIIKNTVDVTSDEIKVHDAAVVATNTLTDLAGDATVGSALGAAKNKVVSKVAGNKQSLTKKMTTAKNGTGVTAKEARAKATKRIDNVSQGYESASTVTTDQIKNIGKNNMEKLEEKSSKAKPMVIKW